MSAPARPSIGWLAAFGLVFIWSGWVVVSRFGVNATLTIYDIAALRYAVASLAVAPFVWRLWPRHLRWWQAGLIACGQGAPFLLFALGGMQFAPAAHAGVVMNGTLPVFAAVLGWIWLKDRPDTWRILGMAAILAGCGLVAWDRDSGGIAPHAWIGHLLFLGSAFVLAISIVGTKAWQLTAPQAMVCIPTLNLAFYGPIYLAFLPKSIAVAPWTEILLQGAYQGLGPSLLGVLLFTTAIRSLGPSPAAAMMALVPGVATLIAIPVLGEWPGALAWAGIVFATGGILLAAGWRPRP